jgi:hypothetical protein
MSEKPADEVQEWYLRERGITPETLTRCKVTTDDNHGAKGTASARWPLGDAVKTRTGFLPGEIRKFSISPKGKPFAIWHLPVKESVIKDPVIVCEGETDAMRLWQDGGAHLYGKICAIPGCDAMTPDAAADLLKRAGKAPIYFVLDNDKTADGEGDYNPDDWKDKKNPVRHVDDSWKRIKQMLPRARRIYLPADYKDICEYLNIYKVADFDKFVVGAEARYNYDALDLSAPATAPEYLWQDFIPEQQCGLLIGDSGVGKSLVYLALAVALANGEQRFLGRRLNPMRNGRVLIVDEENPEGEVRSRLRKLGLRPDCQKNLRVISQRGVRLDENTDKLFEDVESFNPDLTILDSLVRLHDQDENSASAYSSLFNRGIMPLSRQLGTAVWLLHHTGNNDKIRGSSDIKASADFGWKLMDMEGEVAYKILSRFKSRDGATRSQMQFRFEDTDDGGLEFKLLDEGGDVL